MRNLGKCSYALFLTIWLPLSFATAGTSYTLSDEAIFQACPFRHNDKFSFDGLVSVVRSHLETKLHGNSVCDALVNQINDSIQAINTSYLHLDPGRREKISVNIIRDKLIELNLALTLAEPGSANEAELRSQISILEADLLTNRIDWIYKRGNSELQKENLYRAEFYNHINNIIIAMRNAPAVCIDRMGSWQTLLPSVVGTASLAAGYNSFASQAAISSVLQIVSSVISLFQNRDVKKAISKLVSLENYEILACTYHTIKFTACEYGRAFKMSRDVRNILDLINRKYQEGVIGEYERYFENLNRVQRFDSVFETIAEIGTPVTLDISLISKYFSAQRASPGTIPPPPLSGSPAEKKEWLILVARRGIYYSEYNPSNGVYFSLNEQIDQALSDIETKKADIAAVENEIAKNPSFIDLRAELDSRFPNLLGYVREIVGYLESFVGVAERREYQLQLDDRSWGSLLQVLEIYNALYAFVDVKPEGNSFEDLERYELEVKLKGEELFRIMTKYSIAQVDQQTVLLLGEKIRERIRRAFEIIRQAYLESDLLNPEESVCSFHEYERDQALKSEIISNYESYVGQGVVFREEKIENAREAFWQGFRNEIMDMIEMSFDSKSELVPDLENQTAPHLCSLFADLLAKDSRGKKILDTCKRHHPRLELIRYIQPKDLEIDYEDDCFYANYSREAQTQKILFERYKELKNESPDLVERILQEHGNPQVRACGGDSDVDCGLSAFSHAPLTSRLILNGAFSPALEKE